MTRRAEWAMRCPAVRGFCAAVLLATLLGNAAATRAQTSDVDGNRYTSPTYGYTITWDEDVWTVEDESSSRGEDVLELSNDAGVVTFTGSDIATDANECLELAVDGLLDSRRYADFAQAVSGEDEEPYEGDGVLGPYTGYTDGETAVYLECAELAGSAGVLLVRYELPLDEFAGTLAAFDTLLFGVELEPSGRNADDDEPDSDDDRDADGTESGDETDAIATDEARETDTMAMLLRADDLADLGLEGYGGAYRPYRGQPMQEDLVRIGQDLGMPPAEVAEQLDKAGLERINVMIYGYADFESDGTPDIQSGTELIADITSYVYVYLFETADEDAAEALYDLLDDTSGNDEAEELEGTQTFGDESDVTAMEWADPDDEGGVFNSLDVTFRTGELVGEVRLELPIDADAPEVEQIEALAESFLERIEAVRSGDAAGLSNVVLAFEGADISPLEQRYVVLDGDYDEIAGVEARESARVYEEILLSPVQMYANRQYYADDPADQIYGVTLNAWIHVYDDTETASAYLEQAPERVADAEERDAPSLGDEAIAYTRPSDGYNLWNNVLVRVENVVIRMQVGAPVAPPDAVVDALMEEQLACLEAGFCDPIRPPREFRALAGEP